MTLAPHPAAPKGTGRLHALVLNSEKRPMPITCGHSAHHPTPTRKSSDHHVRYFPSTNDTDDRIIGAPRNRPRRPRPEMDLQCISPTRMESIHHMNKAAPAASPTYKSRDTPPLASATRKSQHRHYSTTTHHHFATTGNDHENHGRLKWRFPRMVATASAGCGGALEAVLISSPAVDAAGNGLDDSLRRPGGLGLRI